MQEKARTHINWPILTAGLGLIVGLGLGALVADDDYSFETFDEGGFEDPVSLIVDDASSAVLPNRMLVQVLNPEGVDSQDRHFAFQEACYAVFGTIVSVKAEAGERLLVEHRRDGEARDNACPSGTLFFVWRNEFETMTPMYQRIKEMTRNDLEYITKLLGQADDGQKLD